MNPRSLILGLFLFIPATALAHADLESSSIEDGATVTESLSEVSLTFTEAAELGFSTFKVYPLPADAATAGDDDSRAEDHDENSGDHDDAAAQAEGGHDDGAADDHGDDGGHGALDAAAETLLAEVIDVQDDEDARADTGVSPSEGQSETVTLRLKEELEPGAYAVMWKVLSVDAHTIEGFLTFTYDPDE
jgi:copper resistance protein C